MNIKNICRLQEDFYQDLDKISLSKAMNFAQRSEGASFIVMDFFALSFRSYCPLQYRASLIPSFMQGYHPR